MSNRRSLKDRLLGICFCHYPEHYFFPTNRISEFFIKIGVRRGKIRKVDSINIIPIYTLKMDSSMEIRTGQTKVDAKGKPKKTIVKMSAKQK